MERATVLVSRMTSVWGMGIRGECTEYFEILSCVYYLLKMDRTQK